MTDIDIESLALKCGISEMLLTNGASVYVPTHDQLLAFANEYAAMLSSDPVAEVKQEMYGSNLKWIIGMFEQAKLPNGTKLFKANPTNTTLVDEVKRLREALKTIPIYIEDLEVNRIRDEALDNTTANLKDLIGEQ